MITLAWLLLVSCLMLVRWPKFSETKQQSSDESSAARFHSRFSATPSPVTSINTLAILLSGTQSHNFMSSLATILVPLAVLFFFQHFTRARLSCGLLILPALPSASRAPPLARQRIMQKPKSKNLISTISLSKKDSKKPLGSFTLFTTTLKVDWQRNLNLIKCRQNLRAGVVLGVGWQPKTQPRSKRGCRGGRGGCKGCSRGLRLWGRHVKAFESQTVTH